MTIARVKRPLIDRLLTPTSIAIMGENTPDGARILANVQADTFAGTIQSPTSTPPPDLAIIASTGAQAAQHLASLAGTGCPAAILTSHLPNLKTLAQAADIRVLGPHSFGLAVPRLGLNASLSHMPVPQGHIALVTQSASLARAVVDWAGPNGVGFSHVVGIGGNADIGFGTVLDFLARDPTTRLILLDIRRIQNAKTFISAARAASRLRPVVALRPGGLLLDPTGQADGIFAAALSRAGIFAVQTLEAFLAAAETLSRARPLRGQAMAVITNAIGPGRLAADAALRAGIDLAILPPEAQQTLTASLPADLTLGLVYAGSAAPTDVASIAAMVGAVPQVGGVLVLLAPTGPADAAAIQSVIAAAQTAHLPVLTCVMGETTGRLHRARIAEAGLPVFATPEQAVQAFGHLLRDRAARQAARELPPSRVLDLAPDHAAAAAALHAAQAETRIALTPAETSVLLACYGLQTSPSHPEDAACQAALHIHEDATFGPAITLAIPPDAPPAHDLPPLNLPLATALAQRAGLTDKILLPQAADALVRISQMLVDLPQIATLQIPRLTLAPTGCTLPPNATLTLHPAGHHATPAISPYPENLVEHWATNGQTFTIRPIRPEDAAAHAALVARIPPEDLRFRFFTAMREIAPEQMVRLTQIDYDREMAFIAIRTADNATVGVARLVCDTAGASGEFAILMEPASKGLGLARHLMNRLIGWARSQGVPTITGQVLTDNHPMLGFMRHLGFAIRHLPDEPDVVEAVLQVQASSSVR